MDLSSAEKLARKLMERHGIHKTWRFLFDDSPSAHGVCHYNVGLITLHPKVVGDDVMVMSVLLHEIAHALTPGHGHDVVWHAKVIDLIREHAWGC
jgi:hypothetical protein